MTLINILTQHTVPGDDGLPENWFPSAMAGFTALVCFLIWDFIPLSNKKQRTLYLMTALYSLGMSAFYGANMPGWLFIPQETGSLIRGAVYGSLFLGAILLSIGFRLQVKTWWGRVGAVSWVLLLGLAFISGWTYKAPLAFVAFALLLASLFPHFYPLDGIITDCSQGYRP